jgi:hypothetical protein
MSDKNKHKTSQYHLIKTKKKCKKNKQREDVLMALKGKLGMRRREKKETQTSICISR